MSESGAESQAAQKVWIDRYWMSPDGLNLHFRDYPGGEGKPPILCLPGLTRNARDFETIAQKFAGEWRLICAEFRGRGESDYARDASTYNPVQYVADIEALLEQEGIARFVAIGTSLGGLVTMLLAAGNADRIAGAVLNDIGPVVESAGLERIREYVGQGRSYPTWMHAARALQDMSQQAFPLYSISDWLRMAKRLMVVGGNGRIVLDYD
ncbi:MAG: alpha/beta hydrolase, partial [Rhizobiales bacterium]|nr:alpha/beta hydrolase [Hyphomicrobiales bacterium]